MRMELKIREDIPAYLADLKQWLEETRDAPIEAMGDFFTARVSGYEDHMARWAAAYRRLAELLPESCRRLLDLGCGTGLELDEIFKRFPGMCVTGIDLCEPMLEELKKKHGGRQLDLRCADYFTAELEPGCYDTAVSFETLHHFQPANKERLFRKLYSALKPGGVYLECDYIACCEEEETLLREECERKRKLANVPEGQFVHFDTPLTLEQEMGLLKNAGFADVAALACIEGVTIIRASKHRSTAFGQTPD